MDIRKNIIITCVSLFVCATILANQKPYVTNLSRDKYHAANKNWSIGQDEKGIMYFGNSIGLLASDGMEWKLFQTPDASLVRAIAVESHHTIYSGGSEDLGRWDRDQSGELKYTSLKGLINGDNPLDNQSFWRIWIEGDKVYFQSFSHIYVYDHHTITPVDGPNAFLLLLKVRNEYWVQEMYGALYQLHNGILNKIPGSEFLNGTTTRVILPYDTDRYLVGTSTGAIYIYDQKNFIPWNLSLSRQLRGQELNCAIYSAKRNTYYLGTQLRRAHV